MRETARRHRPLASRPARGWRSPASSTSRAPARAGPGAAMAVSERRRGRRQRQRRLRRGRRRQRGAGRARRRGRAADRHVRLQRRRGVRRRPDVRRHDPPVHRAARLVSRSSTSELARRASAPSEPVALATVIDGPGVGAKLLVAPERRARRHARRRRARPRRRPRRAGRAGGRRAPACATTARRARRRPRTSIDTPVVRVFVETLRPAAADVDLRRRRLHRRARQGRQGARLPGHGVRRPRGLRHPPPLPDGRRGASCRGRAGVRRARRRARATRRGVHPHPRPEVRRARGAGRARHRASATSA